MTPQITIAASSDKIPKEKSIKKTQKFINEITSINDNITFLTGGGGGLMTLIAEEVDKKNSGKVIGINPIEMEEISEKSARWNPHNDVDIYSGMNFVARSPMLVNSGEVLVALGGGVGTMIEILMAYNLGIPPVVITETGYPTDKIVNIAEDGYIDHKKIVKVEFTPDPFEAVKKVMNKVTTTLKD